MAVEIIQSMGPKDLNPQQQAGKDKVSSDSNQQSKKTPGSATDEVQISDKAKALKNEFEALKTQAQLTSEESQQRIETAKARIESGFYFKDNVLEEMAGKIIDSEPIRSLVNNKQNQKEIENPKEIPDDRGHKVAQAKNRSVNGFYQQNSILSVTADRIIKDLLA